MLRKAIPKTLYWTTAGISIVVCISLYFLLSHNQHQINPKDTTIPNLSQLIQGIQKITVSNKSVFDSWLFMDFKATFSRHFFGLLLGVIISLVIGMAMGCFQIFESFFIYPVSFLSKIPPTAMMAVYFVLFGTENRMFIAMIALSIAPILIQTIYHSVISDVETTMLDKAYTLGASNFEVIYEVIFKQILPRILESIRLQIGPAMIALLAAEMLVADVGFGYRLRIQSRLLNMNVVYIYLIILGSMGFLMDWSMTKFRKWLCPWFEGEQ